MIEKFKSEARKRGICGMIDDWDNCKSKKQLVDLALSIRGIEYVAESCAEGWGLSADYIVHEFEPFNNHKYVRSKDGYTSALYCKPPEDEITIDTTASLIIGFNGTIRLERPISELYIVNSNVTILGEGARVYLYNSTVVNDKHIIIKERKEY